MIDSITFVVIGRNEGRNLPRCFRSIQKVSDNIIFVDSGSEDDSLAIAEEFRVKRAIRVRADHSAPALSRSVGAMEVRTEFIQFLDGDMTLEDGWIPVALKRLAENKDLAAVLGYKKVFTKNDQDFFILSDSKDWEPDYMGGAFLIKTDVYNRAGGLDARFPTEEERDLYVRIRSLGFRVLYIHQLMASHYDLKGKNTDIKHLFFSEHAAAILLPLAKTMKDGNFKSYLFVYRRMLVPLLLDCLTILSILLGFVASAHFIAYAVLFQIIELAYVLLISRMGYFIIWKAGLINLPKAVEIYRRNIAFSTDSS